ncbi:PQQ-dependent dehydrogenase, methanol/ethanol family [Piscinibacter sakaiensis]|uniref:Quino(Hemo)protein alcohol dehydrogenase, PQQ-dependent n=1 Tax=Piscinibacter sakaiensis TaxID=1547922 RepID=A0A0K8NTF0_PISS1|nr:PQQ-dependent dehydrogenase, methanol/ethanol family [Piscinibacter sakaiensis]GAP33643.1 quino(hemo)protein alcohol dehydrogenase, PQQ-dependent [Piscinibacter sakaiensis]
MPFHPTRPLGLAAVLGLLLGCTSPAPSGPGGGSTSLAQVRAAAGKVDGAYIRANAATTVDWPSYGLDHGESRFSRLTQIDTGNVQRLGLAWTYDLESTRGVEATPLVVDGVMFVTASWSVVHAVDVRSGRRLWTFDPKVDRAYGYRGCCDVVNRGVALHKGKVYVAAYDGRLFALDADTGQPVWSRDTIVDRRYSYTITGAPRVFNGKVIIGNGGAEYGVRGYITAYDADTGDQKWRWFTVPGDPSKPFENEAMARAAKTWDPAGRWWEAGGGGTAWDTMTFDPELNLMYVGTGNGSPWARNKRSPAGGDNLYLASIVALDPDTGTYRWHYQQTPGDNWDFTSTQPMILADLRIDGRLRKVILHAPKNGFFFVLDRSTGQFISAKPFTEVNWASGYDAAGRPIETPMARTADRPREIIPSAFGARNWHPMSFNPQTGLVYMPVQNIPLTLMDNAGWGFNRGSPGEPHSNIGWNTATIINAQPPSSALSGRLVAWDPVAQKEVWRQEHAAPWNGGTLTTAGNLVFQGTADGRFVAYDARNGRKLWESPTGTGVVAAPVTYQVDGRQYVSVAVGWGGVYGLAGRHTERAGTGTVYTFALDGKAPPPAAVPYRLNALLKGVTYDPSQVQAGTAIYVSNCAFCHGVPGVDRGGNIPNLGYSATAVIEHLDRFVFAGPGVANGMPDFTGKLQPADVEKLKAFIQGTADAIRPKQP